jgi:hypothetical protein
VRARAHLLPSHISPFARGPQARFCQCVVALTTPVQ